MSSEARQSAEKRCHPGWDFVGMAASALCALHCMLLPIVLPFLAAAAGDPVLEIAILSFAVVTGVAALGQGLRHHRNRVPLIVWGAGIVTLVGFHWPTLGAQDEKHSHVGLSAVSLAGIGVGGFLIVSAHIANLLLHRRVHQHS